MKSCISFEYLEVFNFVRLNLVAQMLWILSLMKNLHLHSRCLEVMGLISREQGGQWKHVKEGAPSILMCHPKCPRSFLNLYYLQAFVPLALPHSFLHPYNVACNCLLNRLLKIVHIFFLLCPDNNLTDER